MQAACLMIRIFTGVNVTIGTVFIYILLHLGGVNGGGADKPGCGNFFRIKTEQIRRGPVRETGDKGTAKLFS